MTDYTLFSQVHSGGLAADANPYTLGVQFSVSQPMNLTAIWFYSPPAAAVLPQTIALFQVSGTVLVASQAAAWSGAAASGWVEALLATPVALTAGTAYKACVNQNTSANWYDGNSPDYWDAGGPGAGGITNGPLSAPNDAGAPGQDSFNAGAALTYPGTAFRASNYWVDPQVSTPAAPSQPIPADQMTASGGSLYAAVWDKHYIRRRGWA